MELEITKQRDYPLLKRKRVTAMCEFAGPTPSIVQFKESFSAKLKVNKDLIAIRHIYQRFGKTKAKVMVHVYENKEDKEKLEKFKKAEKKEIEAIKKKEEEKKKAEEEAKKAAKVEETKEEIKDGKES
ncbi:MAG: hypothetical protein ABIJ18_03490 [archaeon]